VNVCVICEADGVLEALGHWYCVDHLEDGFLDVARFLAQVRGWDSIEVTEHLEAWLEQ
jgi:hypothetical protein